MTVPTRHPPNNAQKSLLPSILSVNGQFVHDTFSTMSIDARLGLLGQEGAQEPKIGAGLKRKTKVSCPRADIEAVAAARCANGFNRSTDASQPSPAPKRGRPPLNEDMTYWRIYVSSDLRNQLNELRHEEGMISPTKVVQFDCQCMTGLWFIWTMVSGAGGRSPRGLCGRLVLSCFLHFSIRICASRRL